MRSPIANVKITLGLLLLLSCMALPGYAAPQVVGKISFARGSNAAQQPGAAPRILGKDAEIFQGDNIQTTERSFVIIEFIDGAKVTVRPNSSFSIDQYQLEAGAPKAQLALHQGGVRTESGDIAKQSPENFQIKTDLATVKAQQADYSVRICHEDCQREQEEIEKQTGVPAKTDPSVVARVADIKGEVYAINHADKNAKERRLSLGAPLYSEDYLHSKKDSFVLMVFRDGEKITLQADSEMAIAKYSYQQQGEQDHALYRLTTGGMRVLTGSIGKANKDAFAVDTPVGTIGIRGTGFDLSCLGSCVNNLQSKNLLPQGQANGLYSHVWQGQIALVNDAGEFLLAMPNSNYVANRNSKAIDLKDLPEILFKNPFPRPDIDNSNLQKLFAAISRKGLPVGLYVAVHQGHVQVDKNIKTVGGDDKIDLGKNEVAHVGQQKELTRLDRQESFQQHDPYLLDKNDKDHGGIDSELTNDGRADADNTYQCISE